MKKTLLLSLICMQSLFAKAAESVLLDFETSAVPATVSKWLNYSTGGTNSSVWAFANPVASDPVNSTSSCYKISKLSNDPYWTGLEITLTNAVTITSANQYLHVLVCKPSTSRIALTYTPLSGSQSSDAWQSDARTNQWIDYVLTIPAGTNMKMFAVKIGDAAGDYFLDQIVLSDSATPRSASAPTSVAINPASRYQTLEGWGASLCWWANVVGGYSDGKIKSICDWITDPNGLNMNIFRFNIGGGDDPSHNHMRGDGGAMPGYKASADAPYDWSQDANQRKVLRQLIASRIAKTGQNDIQLVGFSNSPPYWMTVSGCAAGSVQGNATNLRADMFDQFADYLTEVTRYYHDSLGITFNYLEPFNEPDGGWWKANGNQEGCYFTNVDQMKMIRALHAKLLAKNMLSYCKITANDANNIDNGLAAMSLFQSAGDIFPKVGLISTHSYGGSNRSALYQLAQNNQQKLWQSETGPIGVSGTTEEVLLVMADRIITDLREMKPSAWCDWQLVAGTDPLWGLISCDYSNALSAPTRNIGYYIRAQFSRFLKSGYRLIANDQPNVLTALNPAETELVIVVTNKESYTRKFQFNLSAFKELGKATLVRTRALESLNVKNSSSTVALEGSTLTYDALPGSVMTFIIPINQGSAAVSQPSAARQQLYYCNGQLHLANLTAPCTRLNIQDLAGRIVLQSDKIEQETVPVQLAAGLYIVSLWNNQNRTCRKIYID